MNRKNVIAGIWLIGLGILFLFNYFWPGVLILVGLTMIVSALMPAEKREMPVLPLPTTPDSPATPLPPVESAVEEPLPPVLAATGEQLYLQSLLPETCPACGGPIKHNVGKVVWEDAHTAVCPFCATKVIVTPPAA